MCVLPNIWIRAFLVWLSLGIWAPFFLIPFKGSKVIPSPEPNDIGISCITNFGVLLLYLSFFLLTCRYTLATCYPSPRPVGSALMIHSESGTCMALDRPLEHQAWLCSFLLSDRCFHSSTPEVWSPISHSSDLIKHKSAHDTLPLEAIHWLPSTSE